MANPRKINLASSTGIDISSLPDDYKVLAENNPYLNYNYTPTLWDRLGNFFGFGTGEDKYRTEMELAAKQYDTQLLSLASERNYNEPSQQVARERAAGLNTDLLGLQSQPAPEFNEPEVNPQAPDGTAELQQFAGNIMSVFTTTMGLVNDVVALSGFMEDLSAKRTANLQSFMEAARGYVLDNYDPQGWHLSGDSHDDKTGKVFNEDGSPVTIFDGLGFAQDFDKHEKYAKSMYGSRSDRRKFMSALSTVWKSLPTEVELYKKWHERESARREYAKDRASKYYSSDDRAFSDFIGVLVQGMEDINELKMVNDSYAEDVRAQQLDAEHAEAQNDIAYQNAIDPLAEANAVNAANQKAGNADKADAEVNKVYQDIVHKLSKQADDGSRWAQIGLLVLSAIRMFSVPQFHATSSKSVDEKGNITEKSDRSFAF